MLALGEERFDAAQARGMTLSAPEAVALAKAADRGGT
jgi:hypothetical protein